MYICILCSGVAYTFMQRRRHKDRRISRRAYTRVHKKPEHVSQSIPHSAYTYTTETGFEVYNSLLMNDG